MATVKEIAKLACVSTTTVSRVLTRDPTLSVTPATRLRIEQIARELGYSARRLHASSLPQYTFGLIKGYTDSARLSGTHFFSLTRAVESVLSARGHSKLVFPIENIPDQPLDAVIALGQYSPTQQTMLTRACGHILFLYSSPDPLRFDSLCLDASNLASTAVTYLRQLGHRRIAYIGASDIIGGMRMNDLFFQEIRHALLREDPQGDQWMYIGDYTPTSAYTLTDTLLRKHSPARRPTAIMYATDSLAVGGYRAVKECGLQVGQDVSILSVDDMSTSSYVTPPLSTFHVDVDFIATTAVAMLTDRLNGKRTGTLSVQIPLRLVRRKSCQPYSTG